MSYLPTRRGAVSPAFSPHRIVLSVLALIVLAGCGSGGDAAAPDDDDESSGGRVPDVLVGPWKWEEIGDVVCDPGTGQCGASFARSQSLELTGDGRFTHVLVYESNLGGCSLEVLHQSEGAAEAQGATLLLHIAEGTTRVDDTCGESGVTDESGETDRYTWEISEGEGGTPELVLTDDEANTLGPFTLEE